MHNLFDSSLWQGRDDTKEDPLALRWHQQVESFTLQSIVDKNQAIAILGFASDCGVARNHGRVGASAGPNAIRRMLANLPLQNTQQKIFDAGTIECTDDQLEKAQDEYAHIITNILDKNCLPIGLGGGHEIAYAGFLGLAQYLEKITQRPRIGIINIDAHFDLRSAKQSTSGTPFLQIAEFCARKKWPFNYCCLGINPFANTQALFAKAKMLGVTYYLDEELQTTHNSILEKNLPAWIEQHEMIYLTICLDALPAAFAPGVSAPNPGGIPLPVVEKIIDIVGKSQKLKIADIAEYNPRYDIDQNTARVAARLVAKTSTYL